MTTYESVFLGHDNIIDMVLTSDGDTVNITNTTRATAAFGSTLIDSETSLSVFDWSEGGEGLLHMVFGEESIPVGSYKVVLTLYDVVNTDGIVWDDFRCRVVGEDLSPVPPTDPPILISQGGTGQSTAAAAFDALKQIATETYTGATELATTAECVTGTDTSRVVTPAGLTARVDNLMATQLVPAEYTCYVSHNFTVNEGNHKFDTIQSGIDYMYSVYGLSWGITIYVYPGVYTEQIHSYPGYFIRGMQGNTPINEVRPATLYNTGADAAHYPLRADDGDSYIIQNFNIITDDGGTFGKVCDSRFGSCRFEGGYFIEGTEDVSVYSTWYDCAFYNCKGFNLTGVAPNGRYLVFERCWFGWWKEANFESTHTVGNAVFDMDGGHLAFTNLSIKGDWYHFAKNLHSFGASRHVYDTTKGIVYRGITVSNGLHFISNPMSFKMVGCGMEDGAEMPIPDGEADITADVPITNVIFQNNGMHNGLSGNIQIIDPVKNVGGTALCKYIDIIEAIKSITGEDRVVLHENQTDVPKLTMPVAGTVLIDGGAAYGVAFTGDIVDLGDNDSLSFVNCEQVVGGAITIAGDNAEFHAHDCFCGNSCHLIVNSGVGAIVHLRNMNMIGGTGHPALQINSIDPVYRISFSKLTGAAGEPAVEYTVAANSCLQSKYSTFIHGDGSTNCPLTQTVGGSIDISMYLCSVNSLWSSPNPFLNTISKAGIIDDTEINF